MQQPSVRIKIYLRLTLSIIAIIILNIDFFPNNPYFYWASLATQVLLSIYLIFHVVLLVAFVNYRFSLKWSDQSAPHPTQIQNIKSVSFHAIQDDSKIEINLNEQQRDEFAHFLREGKLIDSIKAITHYQLTLVTEKTTSQYFIFSESIGAEFGNQQQTVFIPKKRGMFSFLQNIENNYKSYNKIT